MTEIVRGYEIKSLGNQMLHGSPDESATESGLVESENGIEVGFAGL